MIEGVLTKWVERHAPKNLLTLTLTYTLTLVFVLTLFSGCAKLPFIGKGGGVVEPLADEEVMGILRGAVSSVSEFKGYGSVTIVASGESMSGTLDVARRNGGFFSAQIYTPFGSAIATIDATDSVGRAVINRQSFNFSYGDFMEEVPLPSTRYITYGNFIGTITANMPRIYDGLLDVAPDTLSRNRRRNTATAVWSRDTVSVRAQVSQKTKRIELIAYNYEIGDVKYSLRFGRFRNGIPHEITIRESGRNYITVTYDSIVKR